MSPGDSEVALFQALESNDRRETNEAKAKFAELLNSSREGWLVSGLVHYYMATGSARVIDVLAKAPAPHDRHLCDKLSEGLKCGWRVEALGLLGHVVRQQPSWLHKIVNYPLFRDVLNLLKTEREIKPLVSGLLLLITLLPMIPTLVTPHLQDVFSIFGRLAAWGAPGSFDAHREHLQFALYSLFQNLYGMFPCNFVDFIKKEYSKRENVEVFTHTVKPMLENVKFHPLLVTASKNTETDSARWKKMEHHDVVVECRRFSSESARKQRSADEEHRFRSRCGTDVSALLQQPAPTHFSSNSTPNLTEPQTTLLESVEPGGDNWFSLYRVCGASALSAPQTPLPLPVGAYQDAPASQTPTLDRRTDGGSPPEAAVEATPENTPIKDAKQRFDYPGNSPVVRHLCAALAQPSSHSQPPSPLKKELSPFNRMSSIESDGEARADSFYSHHRLNRVLLERSQQTGESLAPSPNRRNAASPLKKASGAPDSPQPADWPPAKRKLRADGTPPDAESATREDSEVTELSKRGEAMRSASVDVDAHEEGDARWDDEMMCEGENSNCREKKHGLHMPNSTSMMDLVNRVTRSRFLSQCVAESTTTGTDSTGGDALGKRDRASVAHGSSCPNLKFGCRESFKVGARENGETKKTYKNADAQTVETWPLGYEHMFGDIVQNVCDQTSGNGNASASDDNFDSDVAPYYEVDKYMETLSRPNAIKPSGEKREEVTSLKLELEILYLELLYERHRREVHAVRNRRLLGRSRKNRAAEEQNLALKQQMTSLLNEKEELREQLNKQKHATQSAEFKHRENVKHWLSQLSAREAELESERRERERLSSLLLERRAAPDESSADVQHLRAALFDVSQQLQRAIRKSERGERQSEIIKRLQRELVMYGERDAKRSELVNALPSKTDSLVERVSQQYREQLIGAQGLLQSQSSKMDYLQARETELEATVANKELAAQDLKRQLRLVKEEYGEKLKCVEEKYQSIKLINQRMETHCLELLQRVPQSPQATSRDVTSGFSPQSSPLSASLASSEGHGPLLASRVDEMRNLQVIVNAHEESTSNSVNNTNFEDDAR